MMMPLFQKILLTGVSTLALTSAAMAQQAVSADDPIILSPITLIADGQENVEATGGVAITQEDIEDLAPADVSELFSRNSAVTVSGGAGPSKRIHVFGMEQSNLAVSVDGVPQGVTSWHHTGSNVIDPAFLKSVSVEAGAAAADAGFGAAAGAVRYETVGAQDLLTGGRTQGGRVNLSYGDNGRGWSGSLAGYGVYQNFDWFAMVHATNGDNYENGDGDEVPGSEPAAEGLLTKLGYEFDGHRVELAYEHSKDDADRVIKMNMDLANTTDVYPLKVTRNTLSLRYTEVEPTANWDPEALIYVTRNEYWRPNYATGERPVNGDMDLETETVGGTLKNTFTLGSGNLTTGVDWAYNDYRVDNYGDFGRGVWTAETMQVGAFAQARMEFENGIDLSTGVRFDHQRFTDWDNQRLSDSGVSANATLAYEFAPGYEVFAGGSHTWLGYEIGEFALLHARETSFKTADDFEPSEATNFKVGLNANQDSWNGNITYFDTRLKGLGYYNTDGQYDTDPATVAYLGNDDDYRSRGFTLQGNYTWGSGRVGASFTKAKLTQNGDEVLPQGGTVMPIGDMATLYVDQDIPDYNLRVGATLEWASKLDGDWLRESDIKFEDQSSYTVVNLYGEWRPASYENVVIRLGVDNVFDRNYFERGSYAQRADGAPVYPLYAPGRTVTLGMTMDF